MSVHFETFYSGGMFSSPSSCLRDACEQAARFAETLDPEDVLGFAQAFPAPNTAYVTVWYRTTDERHDPEGDGR